VGAALILTGWLVINNATRSSHDAVYRYSEGILDAYVTQDLENRVDILKKNQLENVQSFVIRYQKEALAAAGKLNLIWPGHLFVVDNLKNVIYCSSEVMPKRLPKEWETIREELVHGSKRLLKGHVPGEEYESFVAHYFQPWGWGVFITIKGDFLHEREKVIWLTVAIIGIITSIVIVVSLGLLLNKLILDPVSLLRTATERIAMKEEPTTIPVKDGDEFGDLSRDIEGMSYKIFQSRKALREAYDELKTLDEMKTSLISNVSHELRTPLTSILGFSKLGLKRLEVFARDSRASGDEVQTMKQEAALRDALNVISDQGKCMAEMIDNIIILMSLISDDTVVELQSQDLAPFVRRVSQGLCEKIESKGLAFTVTIPPEPVPVKVDIKMIELVLNHYISNAIEFTNDGNIDVRLAIRDTEAVVEVHDTGVGMSQDDVEKVFDQFYQAGDVMTEKPKGLGVGLSICRKIVRLHGGRAWIESTPGKGSIFYFSIPIIETVG